MARIGIDARLTYYTQGGIAQYTQHLIRALAALEPAHEFLILHSRKDTRNLAITPDQRRIRCWTPAHHRFERLALAVEIAPLRLHLLHSPDFIPPLDGRYRSVITVHDLAFLRYPQFLTAASRRYYNNQIAAAVARADAIIAVSEATRADLLDLLNVPPQKITVIAEAAGEQFHPIPPEEVKRLRAKRSLPTGYILFVGTIEPRKNINGLLHAYAHLRTILPDAPPLVVVGKRGWLDEEVFTLCKDLALEQWVIWYGSADPADLPALYSGAAVFCLPSFYEGFGLPSLEAMACGTPVIVSNCSSLPEVVGEAGLLVNPHDASEIAEALRRVLTDSDLAAEMRQRGLQRAAMFSWAETARQTLALYERTLEG